MNLNMFSVYVSFFEQKHLYVQCVDINRSVSESR